MSDRTEFVQRCHVLDTMRIDHVLPQTHALSTDQACSKGGSQISSQVLIDNLASPPLSHFRAQRRFRRLLMQIWLLNFIIIEHKKPSKTSPSLQPREVFALDPPLNIRALGCKSHFSDSLLVGMLRDGAVLPYPFENYFFVPSPASFLRLLPRLHPPSPRSTSSERRGSGSAPRCLKEDSVVI